MCVYDKADWINFPPHRVTFNEMKVLSANHCGWNKCAQVQNLLRLFTPRLFPPWVLRVGVLVFLVLSFVIGIKYYFAKQNRTLSTDPEVSSGFTRVAARFGSNDSIAATGSPVNGNAESATERRDDQATIYIVTATYQRPEQQAELTRLAQTLMNVPNIRWILVEHAKEKSSLVSMLVRKWTIIPTIHLNTDWSPLPPKLRWMLKGANCKNLAVTWIREHVSHGVLYFADDDNSYDIDLFKEMRSTKKVAMWPVGLVTHFGLSTPVVKNGQLVGFYDGWYGGRKRKFPIDMAGFAVNINFLKQRPKAQMCYRIGYHEDSFLRSLAPFEPAEIELKADNCTKVLVWHTKSKHYSLSPRLTDTNQYANTNLIDLMKIIV